MSKIAVILGPFSIGTRPLDFSNLMTNDRGLTGTDLSFIRTVEELNKLGHEVHSYTVFTNPGNWKNLHKVDELPNDSFDVVVSINEPAMLNAVKAKTKILWQFLNDFTYCDPNWEDQSNYDIGLGVCEQHTNHLRKQVKYPERWDTLGLGCDPDLYENKRIPGRVIWCSSADRGLHHLLSQWSKIKSAVPSANLRIFYHFFYNKIETIEENTGNHPHVVEMAQRIRYMKDAIQKLKGLGVEHVGSVSREKMAQEFSEASTFAYSCDTVAFSEGFSVSTLEAHASFTVPVITSCDCFGSIYSDSGCYMVRMPIQQRLNEFTEKVIESLTKEQEAVIEKCRKFAANHTWKKVIADLERIWEKRAK